VSVFRIGSQQAAPVQAVTARQVQAVKPAVVKQEKRAAPAPKPTRKYANKPAPKAAAPTPSPVLATAGSDQDWETF
jgi:methyl-accepting chemotaxis protein